MEVLYPRCCGLDVHRTMVVACVSISEAGQRRKAIRTFRTVTKELRAMRQWLLEEGCSHVKQVHLIQDRTPLINRLLNVLQQAGMKLSGVLSDVMGVSGRAILAALCAGERDPERLASLVHKSGAHKHAQLVEALTGDLRSHQQFLLRELLTL